MTANYKNISHYLRNVLHNRTSTQAKPEYYRQIDGDTQKMWFQHTVGKSDWFNNFDFPKQAYGDTESVESSQGFSASV